MFRLPAILFSAALGLAAADDLDTQIKRAIEAFAVVEQNAATPISSEQVFYQGAIPGLLRKLDPHSAFFDPGQYDQLRKMEASTQKGFGTIVSLLPGRVIVLQTLPGTPSARRGWRRATKLWASTGTSSTAWTSISLANCSPNRGSARRSSTSGGRAAAGLRGWC